MKECNHCHNIKPLDEFHKHAKTKDGRNSCCKKCQYEKYHKQAIEKRHIIKQQLIEEAGGKCVKCGYNKCAEALEFHHRDPNEKDIGISDIFRSYIINEELINQAREEIKKCDLLCANCHREEHYLLKNRGVGEVA